MVIFQTNSLVSPGSLLFFFHLTRLLFAVSVDGQLLYFASKHLCFTFVKVSLLESVWRGLDWQGRKATISVLQDIEMLQQRILIDSLPCQTLKTQRPGRVYKGALPTGKAWKKEVFQRHAHVYPCTHMYTHAHRGTDTLTVNVSSHHAHSHSIKPPEFVPGVS